MTRPIFPFSADDEPMITERELAERTRTSPTMWRHRRYAGNGPPFRQIGRAIRYRWSEVETWISKQTIKSQ